MSKIKYYLSKFNERIKKIFSYNRIKKYGIRLAFLDLLIFFMHRNGGRFEHYLIRKKDLIVQRYLYNNFYYVIESIKNDSD